ncbi:unnamed protein product [Spirodela intermedia]|uniref:Reverse transcriptase Ty1/copia-type domain-containing protein n=1 Tax=Spirodela intermedia TaxID=51605 RepID=A0A7I8KU09_SPIIN|nr:unnamed protein product [Spirodela intermedia]
MTLFLSYNRLSPSHKAFVSNLNTTSISKTVFEALTHEKWRQAMNEEMEALRKNDTWGLVRLPIGKKVVGCKWVYTIKYHSDGSIERYKARLVAKEYTKNYGVDSLETFAPVAKMNTIRVLLSLTINSDWDL